MNLITTLSLSVSRGESASKTNLHGAKYNFISEGGDLPDIDPVQVVCASKHGFLEMFECCIIVIFNEEIWDHPNNNALFICLCESLF